MKPEAATPPTPQSFVDMSYIFDKTDQYYGLLSPGFAAGTTKQYLHMGDALTRGELKKVRHLDWVPADYLAFCRLLNGFHITWEMDENPELYLHGRIIIEPLHRMVLDRAGTMYFPDNMTPAKAPMRDFKALDACTDETVVGLYYTAACNPELHYYDLDDEPAPLGVDFSGYLALLRHTLGCYSWQELLLELDAPTPETRPFRPQYFPAQEALERLQAAVPDFDLDAFVACYDLVRLPTPTA